MTSLAVAVNSGDVGASGNPGYSSKVAAAISISGFLPHSVASFYDPSDSPVLMFNGTADPTVAYSKGVQTAADLYNAKVPVVFEPLEGGGHVPMKQFGDTIVTQSVNFSYAFLDLAHATGQPAAAARAFERQATGRPRGSRPYGARCAAEPSPPSPARRVPLGDVTGHAGRMPAPNVSDRARTGRPRRRRRRAASPGPRLLRSSVTSAVVPRPS